MSAAPAGLAAVRLRVTGGGISAPVPGAGVQLDQQRPVLQRTAAGPRCQHAVQHHKEQQHRAQHQAVLDRDEQVPDFAGEDHAGVLFSGVLGQA